MKETDWRNTLEVIVKGLVAVVVGLAGLWILGWVLSFLGGLLLGLAGIIVALLRWLVPIAIIVGIVYFAVTQLQGKKTTVIAGKAATEGAEIEKAPVVDAEAKSAEAVSEGTAENHESLVEELDAKVSKLEQKLVDEVKKDG